MTEKIKNIELYDTTLRDGAQMNGISFSTSDKIKLINALDRFGVQFIEAGYPGSSPQEAEFFNRLKDVHFNDTTIVAFGMTCRKNSVPENDKGVSQLVSAGTDIVTVVGKASRFQVHEILKTDIDNNLRMIRETCAYLVSQGKAVFFDLEHFFDGWNQDPGYTLECVNASIDGGAIRVIFCDTNGGFMPSSVAKIIQQAKKQIEKPVSIGIHAHNDCGFAVANSIVAFENGVSQIQGTINGYGERCGNADLITVIGNLQLKMGIECVSDLNLSQLFSVSRFVADVANLQHNSYQPFVGQNAFCHKGGMHGDGHAKNPRSYQHIDPKLVGNKSNLAISKLAGKSIINTKAKDLGIDFSAEETESFLVGIEKLEAEGFSFEGTDASLELLMRRHKKDYVRPFEILRHRVTSEQSKGGKPKDEALLVVRVSKNKKTRTVTEVAIGSGGPLSVMETALRKAIKVFYGAEIKSVRVVGSDYKVRALGGDGTSSLVRVLIPFTDGKKTWATVGVSKDSVGAKCQALSDGLEYAILKALE